MNAKSELIHHIDLVKSPIKCAEIHTREFSSEEKTINLKVNYTDKDYYDFLKSLDFTYDSGYGEQELFGTIWYIDSSWSERGEYDGSEWWEYKSTPEIPKDLL